MDVNETLIVTSATDGRRLLATHPGLNKLRSWAALWALDVPTLSGVVVDDRSVRSAQIVKGFADSIGADRLLLRSDAAYETGRYPRGGFEVRLENVERVVEGVTRLGRTVFLLEPKSALADEYSLGVLLWPDEPVQVEVVGPGFDASDLKRGDLSPHERFSLERGHIRTQPSSWVISHDVVTPNAYLQCWNDRLRKIGSLLAIQEAAGPTDVHQANSEIRVRLKELGETRFLRARQGYESIPDDLLLGAVQQSERLATGLQLLGFPGEPLVVSMSYWGPGLVP